MQTFVIYDTTPYDYINTNIMKDKELTRRNNERKHPERARGRDITTTGKYYRDENGSIRKVKR